jgi:hypothetical protein
MKTKLTSLATALLAASILCLTAPPAPAQDLPPLSQIVSNVVQATRPTEAYTVTVNQTLSPPQANAALGTTASAGQAKAAAVEAPMVQTFDTAFEPTKRQWMPQRSLPHTPKAQGPGQHGTNKQPDQPAVQITIDLEAFMESLLSSNQGSVARDELHGRSCYKIDARSGQDRVATLWVDAERWHVSKAIVYLMNRRFAEMACQYREVNGRWLFSKIAINHAFDGSHADLEYGEYKRTGPK